MPGPQRCGYSLTRRMPRAGIRWSGFSTARRGVRCLLSLPPPQRRQFRRMLVAGMALPTATPSAEERPRRNGDNAGFSSSRQATKSFEAILRSSGPWASRRACFTSRRPFRRHIPQGFAFALPRRTRGGSKLAAFRGIWSQRSSFRWNSAPLRKPCRMIIHIRR